MSTKTKTLRLPANIVDAAERSARALGLTFTDVTEVALRKHLGLEDDPCFELLTTIRERLLADFPRKTGFPQDVTLRVFHQIRDDPAWSALYRQTIGAGDDPAQALASLHRRIGKAVRLILDAGVVGRSLPLDPAEHLIKTHALLVPTQG